MGMPLLVRWHLYTESAHYSSPWYINKKHLLGVYQGATSIRLLLGPLTLKQTRTPVAHGRCTYMYIYIYEYTSMSIDVKLSFPFYKSFSHALIVSYRIWLEKCSVYQNSNVFYYFLFGFPVQWRHMSVMAYLSGLTIKKTSNLALLAIFRGIPQWPTSRCMDSAGKTPVTQKGISMPWRHHVYVAKHDLALTNISVA